MRTNGVSRKQRQLKAATLAWLPIAVLLCCHSTTWAAAPDVYAPRPVDEVRTQLTRWLTQHSFNNEKTASQIAAVWSAGGGAAAGRDAFDRLITSFSIADSETRRFVETSTPGQSIKVFPSADFLNRDDADEFYSMNLRLFYARALTQRLMYDEALAFFADRPGPGCRSGHVSVLSGRLPAAVAQKSRGLGDARQALAPNGGRGRIVLPRRRFDAGRIAGARRSFAGCRLAKNAGFRAAPRPGAWRPARAEGAGGNRRVAQ